MAPPENVRSAMTRSALTTWIPRAAAVAVALAGCLVIVRPVTGQEHPIRAELHTSAPNVAAGGRVTVGLRATIPSGWHLYSVTQPPGGPVPTTIDIATPQFKLAGPIDGPIPVSAYDPNFSIT